MKDPKYSDSLDAASRLDEVARILALGILRAKLRHQRKAILAAGTRENGLELLPESSPPVREQSRKGAP